MSGLLRYSQAQIKTDSRARAETSASAGASGVQPATPDPFTSLVRQGHALSSVSAQRAVLDGAAVAPFAETVARRTGKRLLAAAPRVLQLNLGRQCQQACRHCHVDAGPDRVEQLTDEVLEQSLLLLEVARIPVLDITGGAPELHPRAQELITRGRALGAKVMLRCNLTLLVTRPYQDWPAWLASMGVEIVASLPHFLPGPTDAQRGKGVHARSIEALQRLNAVGYAQEGSSLVLQLVSNPSGAFLAGGQRGLEQEFRRELLHRYGVRFTTLWVLNNMPISRFLAFLVESGNFEPYLHRLEQAFNPDACAGLMCHDTLSVDWQGRLFDCDFNQMMEMPLDLTLEQLLEGGSLQEKAWSDALVGRVIQTGVHCYGCTAGAGSSCGGATIPV